MSSNEIAVLQVLAAYTHSESKLTVGQVADHVNFSKSTVRRALQLFANWGLVCDEWKEYKSTGKRVFYITDEGRITLSGYRRIL